jgi:hypothetical protein
MPTVLVLFNLKANASIDDYETWAKTKDIPTVQSLGSINDFRVLKLGMILGTDKPSPYQYAELLEINDMEVFFAELGKEEVQAGAKQFNEFADSPLFILADDIKP